MGNLKDQKFGLIASRKNRQSLYVSLDHLYHNPTLFDLADEFYKLGGRSPENEAGYIVKLNQVINTVLDIDMAYTMVIVPGWFD